MIRWLVYLALAALGVSVLTESSLRRKQIMRKVSERVQGFDRLVDIGVVLRVIRPDPKGAIQLVSGRTVTVIREHRWGGIIDTKATKPTLVDISRDPQVWLCSEDQEQIILHPSSIPLGHLVIGSEGSGKTTALAMWHHKRWCENVGDLREGGQTAPTLSRLGLVKAEILKLWPSSWRRFVNRDDFVGFELCDGSRIRFVSTAPRPEKQGSPIQGYNWSWCGRDEVQDQVDVHSDIEARGRAARAGKDGKPQYKQLGTATAKDDPHWREFRDSLLSAGAWGTSKLLIERSPFVAPGFLEEKRKSGMTDREFRRRFLAEDVPPESRLYFNWSREHNLRPIPMAGARDITSIVLGRKIGPGFVVLLGHDPGTAKAASVFLQAYEIRGVPDPIWWVRGELFTMHQTPQQHALQARTICRDRFGGNVHVRAQPMGTSDDKPDLDTYKIWRDAGFDIRAAQVKADGTGTGKINRESRIAMVNTLLVDAAGVRRLYVECDDQRRPVAPKLVEAFESMERDERGRIDSDKRLDRDKSDPPDALGYALWPWEKALASVLRNDIRNQIERTSA
mgnify:CR=1 FL=1